MRVLRYSSACLLAGAMAWLPAYTTGLPVPSAHPVQGMARAGQDVVVDEPAEAPATVTHGLAADEVPGGNVKASEQAHALYEQAYAAYQSEDWGKAKAQIERAIAIDPTNIEYHKLASHVAAEREDYAGVVVAADAALEIDGQDGEVVETRANALYLLGDRERALEGYRKAVALDYREARLYHNFVFALSEMRRYDELLEVYEGFARRQDEMADEKGLVPDILFHVALACSAHNDHRRAIALLTEAIGLSPGLAGYYGNRAVAYDAMREFSLALADLAEATRLAPKDPVHWFNRGLTWLHLGEHRRALDDFSKARSLGKRDADVWLNLGAAHQGLGQDAAAVRAYDRALELDPANAMARSNRATLLRGKGRAAAAERDHARALATLPDDGVAILCFNDAQARISASDWAGALPLLQEAVRLNPDFEKAWVNLGAAHYRLGQRQRALDVFNDVLARNPESTMALGNRAVLLDEMGDAGAAGRDYERAVSLEPTNAGYLESFARHHARAGDRRKAQVYFELARAAATESAPEVFVNYSAFLLESGEHRQALVVAREGAERFPARYDLTINLANALGEAGDGKDAVAAYRRAMALLPDRLDAYYNLGNQYAFRMKQPRRAIEWFERALQRTPDPALDAEAQRDQRLKVRLNLATALELAGDNAGALRAMQAGIDADPDDYRIYYNRAGFLLRAADEAGAQRDYRAALERMERLRSSSSSAADPGMLEHMGQALVYLGRESQAASVLEQLLRQQPENHSARRSLGYVLLDLERPADACPHFDQSFTAEPDEIDGWLGLLACGSIKGDERRLEALKTRFGKRFEGRHALGPDLPEQLGVEGYWYSPRFRRLWARVMANP